MFTVTVSAFYAVRQRDLKKKKKKSAVWLQGLQQNALSGRTLWEISIVVRHNKNRLIFFPQVCAVKHVAEDFQQSCQENLSSLIPIIRLRNPPWQRYHEDVSRSLARARRLHILYCRYKTRDYMSARRHETFSVLHSYTFLYYEQV